MNARAWFYSQSFHSHVNVQRPAAFREEIRDTPELKDCDTCGAEVERLYPVESADLSVGHRETLYVCGNCAEGQR
jgi:hypothetical protein